MQKRTLYRSESFKKTRRFSEMMNKMLKIAAKNNLESQLFPLFSFIKNALNKKFEELRFNRNPFYRTYTDLLKMLYPEGDPHEIFIIHSAIQLFAAARFSAIIGDDIDSILNNKKWNVCVPYLSVLPLMLDTDYKKEVYDRVSSLESDNTTELFRKLYEAFIDVERRRAMGEYYTPTEIVKRIVKCFSLKGKKVMDPFCGSGSFLVEALEKKVKEGEQVDDAITEIIGFDINPLAVSLARISMASSYLELGGRGTPTPLVFNSDIALFLATGEQSFMPQIPEIDNIISAITGTYECNLARLENTMKRSIYPACKQITDIKTTNFFISKYNLLPIIISSIVALKCINTVDVIITNPPWKKISAIKGVYGKKLREIARKFLRDKIQSGITKVISGSDLSSVMLMVTVGHATESAYIMPSSVVSDGTCYGAGKILTYYAIKNKNPCIARIERDPFGHNVPAVIVFIGGDRKTIKKEFGNAISLTDYRREITPIMDYITMSKYDLLRKASLWDAFPQGGSYIRGFLGGERKRKEKFAGIVVEGIRENNGRKIISLKNTGEIGVPGEMIKTIDFVYMKGVFPFSLKKMRILYGKNQTDVIKMLLRLKEYARPDDRKKIAKLISELKYNATLFEGGLVQRADSTPVAVVANGKFICSNVALYTGPPQVLYYYAFILNMLSYLAVNPFRHQYLRPMKALVESELGWKNAEWQHEISQISRGLHSKRYSLSTIRKSMNVLEKNRDFNIGLEIIAKHVKGHYVKRAVLSIARGYRRSKMKEIFG